MPGYFDGVFDDDEPQSYFWGYRPRTATGSTGANATDMEVSDKVVAPTAVAAGNAPDILRYANGEAVIADPKTGEVYALPPGFDMQKNLAIAQTIKEAAENADLNIGQANPSLMFAPHFLPGSDMDYQRPNGFSGPQQRQYRPIGYYNYGVTAAKAGYGKDEAIQNAGLYNRMFGGRYWGANGVDTLLGDPPTFHNPYGLNGDDAQRWIEQGYKDYMDGRWSPTK